VDVAGLQTFEIVVLFCAATGMSVSWLQRLLCRTCKNGYSLAQYIYIYICTYVRETNLIHSCLWSVAFFSFLTSMSVLFLLN
jgi:hypothetical protein